MKKGFRYLLMTSCTTLLFFSCNDFLDEKIKGSIPADQFYSNLNEVVAAVNGVYAALNPSSIEHIWINELPSDDATLYAQNNYTPPQDRVELLNLVPNPSLNWFQTVWSDSYRAINRANTVLEKIRIESVKDTVFFNRLCGEVRFLRAWHYFRLVQWFGGVPLMLKSTDVNDRSTMSPPCATDRAVYDQIISDFTFASKNLPYKYDNSPDNGRATKGAAFTYLGKVYLTMYGYPLNAGEAYLDSAKMSLDSVVANKLLSGYDAPTNPTALNDLFDPEKVSTNKETIFAAYAYGDANSWSGMYAFFLRQSGNLHPTDEAWTNVFDVSDLRRNSTFGKKITGSVPDNLQNADPMIDPNSNVIFIRKYLDVARGFDYARNSYIYTRYSDVLLMRAEVLCLLGNLEEAAQDLVPIRTRANLSPALLTYDSQADLLEKIRSERRKELMFEGHRRSDLIRWGIYPEIMKVVLKNLNGVLFDDSYIDNTRCLFPLPAKELILNPSLKDSQNPGYN